MNNCKHKFVKVNCEGFGECYTCGARVEETPSGDWVSSESVANKKVFVISAARELLSMLLGHHTRVDVINQLDEIVKHECAH